MAAKPALLAGGNPQIAKAEGDAPVRAYIAAMPGWKRDVGRRLDALIVRTVPGVRKAVKWNSPFYGVAGEGKGWFLSYHCFTKYIKVAFFRGASLRPLPPGASKHKEVRYLDIREDDPIDEAQLAAWVKQTSQLPDNGIGADCARRVRSPSTSSVAATGPSAGHEQYPHTARGHQSDNLLAPKGPLRVAPPSPETGAAACLPPSRRRPVLRAHPAATSEHRARCDGAGNSA